MKNKENLEENKLCSRGKKAAKARYDKYPSKYANGHAVQVCKGKIKGLDGEKKTASGYQKKKGKPQKEGYKYEVEEMEFESMEKMFEQLKKDLIASGYISEDYVFEELNEAEYKGRKVKLNKPFRDSSGGKKFAVYVKSKKGNVKKVRFGASGYRVKNSNKKAASNFQKRHNCKNKKDKTTAGYWSCNAHRYKSLKLQSSRKW